MYVTISHINDFLGIDQFRVGDELYLQKETDNNFDDETIKVVSETGSKCGYVANSVSTVARGTHSAGYVYNLIQDKQKCKVEFIIDEYIIASFE